MGLLCYGSVGGVMASLILVFSVMWVGGVGGVGFHERGSVMKWSGIPTALSLFAFCYSGHSVYPTIYASMADKTKFSRVLFVSFAVCTINYGVMAVVGYLMFGQATKSQVTLNLPVENMSSKIAIYTTLINPLAKYALIITPLVNAIEEWLQVSKSRFIGILIRTVILISTVIIALTVPYFGYVVALTGSFLSSSATMVLPSLCYLKIFKSSRRWGLELVMILAILVVGVFIAVIGTYVSMKQIVSSL
ncbi:amino acid transporter ANTL1-like [Phalaenopsis equestris]|uniref:amino acid transporter ANTL1-like n=1 Tax=Phalaenopsis equestris TaxID=78828 RepID=UPI0009E48CDA|nr:amino acid transporter ANTL1-like [Phalaenopsis equestris]